MSGFDPIARGLAAKAQADASLAVAAVGAATDATIVSSKYVFTTMPEIHGASGETVAINGRTPGDGMINGPWNVVHDGLAGDVLHFTTGPNTEAGRTVADLVTTAGSKIVTSATAAFRTQALGAPNGTTGSDAQKVVIAAGIPAGTVIASVQSATQATLSANATETATGVSAQIGASLTGNPNGAVFAVGVGYGGTGVVVRNYWKGIGLNVQQLPWVSSPTAYAFFGLQQSNVAPWGRYAMVSGTTQPMLYMAPSGSVSAGATWLKVGDNGGTAGYINADNGVIDWRRTIQSVSPDTSSAGMVRATSESLTQPSEAYLSGSSAGDTGFRTYRYSGTGSTFYAAGWLATTDRLKLVVGDGAQTKGAETLATVIEARAIAGGGRLGFFGVAPVAQQAATVDLKSALVLYGFLAAGGSATPLNLEGGRLTAGDVVTTGGGMVVPNGQSYKGYGSDGVTTYPLGVINGSNIANLGNDAIPTYVRGSNQIGLLVGNAEQFRISTTGAYLPEGKNLQVGTATGTRIGTAATQKLGFFGATPVVQPAATPAAATDLATALTLVNDLRGKLLALGLAA